MCVPSRHFGRNPAARAPTRCAPDGADEGDRWLLQREIKVGLIASLFMRRHLPFLETIEGAARRDNVAHDARCIEHCTRARETTGGGIGHNAFAGGSSDGCQFWPGWSRHRCRNWSGRGLAESKSQQARAQEHDACRGQGKESVGDYVVVAHETPTTQMLVRIY
jgi:hypothetical protein